MVASFFVYEHQQSLDIFRVIVVYFLQNLVMAASKIHLCILCIQKKSFEFEI